VDKDDDLAALVSDQHLLAWCAGALVPNIKRLIELKSTRAVSAAVGPLNVRIHELERELKHVRASVKALGEVA
jgi:outer membrane murein-binding lipoprotein Lpp